MAHFFLDLCFYIVFEILTIHDDLAHRRGRFTLFDWVGNVHVAVHTL